MPLLSICQWIQDTGPSTAVRESTWGFPMLGALHVLALAWFGGALALGPGQLRGWKRAGIAALLVTGALLFCVEPVKCYHSAGFWVKMALLLAIALSSLLPRTKRAVSLILWAGVVFAARAIGFF